MATTIIGQGAVTVATIAMTTNVATIATTVTSTRIAVKCSVEANKIIVVAAMTTVPATTQWSRVATTRHAIAIHLQKAVSVEATVVKLCLSLNLAHLTIAHDRSLAPQLNVLIAATIVVSQATSRATARSRGETIDHNHRGRLVAPAVAAEPRDSTARPRGPKIRPITPRAHPFPPV